MPKSIGEVLSSEGQAVQSVPVVFEDVVYCNVCNVNGDKTDRGLLKNTTVEQALQQGWVEMNWGPTCPECQKDLDNVEEGVLESGAMWNGRGMEPFIKHFTGR